MYVVYTSVCRFEKRILSLQTLGLLLQFLGCNMRVAKVCNLGESHYVRRHLDHLAFADGSRAYAALRPPTIELPNALRRLSHVVGAHEQSGRCVQSVAHQRLPSCERDIVGHDAADSRRASERSLSYARLAFNLVCMPPLRLDSLLVEYGARQDCGRRRHAQQRAADE